MPPNCILTALAVVESDEGVRCYPKTADGLIRELCLNFSPADLQNAMREKNSFLINHSDKWFLGELTFQCHPQSNVCSLIDSGLKKSLFYQDTDGALRERRHASKNWYQEWTWHPTALEQRDCLLGTNIAAVQSLNRVVTVLFFQDDVRSIISQISDSDNPESAWERKAKRIAKAPKGRKYTGLAALASGDLGEITLYYQDKDGRLCECHTSLSGKTTSSKPVCSQPYERLLHNISVVTLNDGEIRLYMQDDRMNIIEWIRQRDSNEWARGDLDMPAPSDSNIIAVSRSTVAGTCIQIYWSHKDEVIRKRVWFEGQWGEPQTVFHNCSVQDLTEFWRRLQPPSLNTNLQGEFLTQGTGLDGEAFGLLPAFPIYVEGSFDEETKSSSVGDMIALRAQNVTFKVRREVLCQSSSLFNDMFSIPQPIDDNAADVYEGCHLVPLQDSVKDLEAFIRVLHDGSILKSCGALDYIKLLDIASKYQAWALVKRLMAVLEHEYPDTFDGFGHLVNQHPASEVEMHLCPLQGSYLQDSSFHSLPVLLTVLQVARRANMQILLPSVILLCCIHDIADIRNAAAELGLGSQDLDTILDAQDNLSHYANIKLKPMFNENSLKCSSPDVCHINGQDAIRILFFPFCTTLASSPLCTACVSNFWETSIHEYLGENVWEQLPETFGIDQWEKLQEDYDEFWDDVENGRA